MGCPSDAPLFNRRGPRVRGHQPIASCLKRRDRVLLHSATALHMRVTTGKSTNPSLLQTRSEIPLAMARTCQKPLLGINMSVGDLGTLIYRHTLCICLQQLSPLFLWSDLEH